MTAEATAILAEATSSSTPWITLTSLMYDQPNSLTQAEKVCLFHEVERWEQFQKLVRGQ